MKLNELTSSGNAKAYRKGRGPGSGNGKTSGRGHKGQNSRSGGGVRPGFEGGQMPLYRRLGKRGFNNKRFAKQYIILNVADLEAFENGTTVTAEILADAGILSVPKVNDGIKVLGLGELTKKLTVEAVAFSTSAKEKIEKAGGTVVPVRAGGTK